MPLGHPFRKWKKAKTSQPTKAPKKRRGFNLLRDFEPLEPRQLLTLLVGGDTFEFRHAGVDGSVTAGIIERIKLFGNITVQAVGAYSGAGGFTDEPLAGQIVHNTGIFQDVGFVDPQVNGGAPVVGIQPRTNGVVGDLFALYVINSDETGEIVVSDVPELTVAQRPMLPFTNSIGVIKEANLRTTVAAPGGTGTAILGTRIPPGNAPPNAPDPGSEPVTSLVLRHSYPGSPLVAGTPLTAGLIVAAGQTMGRFLFGGTVMGAVQIHGSIDTFYAGWLITGDAAFATGYGIVSNPRNFLVDGDIRNLIVKGDIGTDAGSVAGISGGTLAGMYASGFDMFVGGSLGWLHTGGSLNGNVLVAHSAPASTPLLGSGQWELETRSDGILQDAAFFGNYPFAQANPNLPGSPSIPPTTTNFGAFDPFDVGLPGGDQIFFNDNYDQAQYLGSIPTTIGGPNSAVSVSGVLENGFTPVPPNALPNVINDATDYYAVPLMAGQTITVQLTVPQSFLGPFFAASVGTARLALPIDVGVFDPDGRLIATDYNSVDPAQTQGQPFRITTDRPGVYRFAIAIESNSEFETEPAQFLGAFIPYNLSIQNVGDLAVGGILANQDIIDDNETIGLFGSAATSSFSAFNGDFGALKAAGAIVSLHIGNSINIPNGNLRVVEGASIGAGSGIAITNTSGYISIDDPAITTFTGIDLQVPKGSVGLINASGTPTGVASPTGVGAGTVLGTAGTGSSEVAGIPFSPGNSVQGVERLGSTYPGGAMNPGANGGPAGAVTTADGLMMLNYGYGATSINPQDAPAPAIGGDYQIVSAIGSMGAKLYANGNIGTVRAGNLDVLGEPCYFRANVAADPTKRGTIDLIDVEGNFEEPRISTGPRGDVRYIKVQGTISRDPMFGRGQPNNTYYNPGVAVTIQDDSGASLTFTPAPQRPDPANPANTLPAGQLYIETYPIESYQGNGQFSAGGGSVVLNVVCSGSLTITSSAEGNADETAEVSRIEIIGVGTPVINTTTASPVLRGGNIGQITTVPPVTQPLAPGTGGATNGPSNADGTLLSQTPVNGGTLFTYQDGAVFFTTAGNRTVVVTGTAGSANGTGLFGALASQTISASNIVFTFSDGTIVTLDTTTGVLSVVGGTAVAGVAGPIATAGPSGLTGLQETTANVDPLSLTINGNAQVDVLNTVVTSFSTNNGPAGFNLTTNNLPNNFGNATAIANNTGGELVSLLAESVGTLFSSGTLGIAKHHTAAATLPAQTLIANNAFPGTPFRAPGAELDARVVDPPLTAGTSTTFPPGSPYVQAVPVVPFIGDLFPFGYGHQTIGIQIMHGNILTVEAPTLGNLLIDGSIGQVIADKGGQGIVAPITAFDLASNDPLPTHKVFGIQPAMNSGAALTNHGSIGSVNIGGGVAYSGSGYVMMSGIYTDKRIGTVTGTSADIRGNIVSDLGIDSVSLRNGSIIDANIEVVSDPAMSIQPPEAIFIPQLIQGVDVPTLDLGNISTTGNGGIIGMRVHADHLGNLTVKGGFGIFESLLGFLGEGTINTIRAEGYGIRSDTFEAGASLGHLIAAGNGGDVPVTTYSPDVRLSENDIWDPFTGRAPNVLTDLYAFLNRGTPAGGAMVSAANPSQIGMTDTGIIEDTTANGSRDLGSVQAFAIRDNVLNNGTGTSTLHDNLIMKLDFANSIGTIQTTGTINGLEVTTGRIRKLFRPGSDVSRLVMTVTGNIKSIIINGSLLSDSIINCSGINGTIGNVLIKGDLNGTIQATKRIGTVKIMGNLVGNIGDITGNVVEAGAINKLMILGRIMAGTFTINGNLGSLIMPGDIGLPGETFVIHGSAKTIQIGGNYNINTTIEGNLKTLKVGGSVTAGTSISIAGSLSTLQVGGDIQTGATITAHPLPPIKKRKIGGTVSGTLIG